jgi:hypothetical protein
MGISVQTVSSEVARYYNMVEGAYVYTVDSMSCAAKPACRWVISSLPSTARR